MRECYPEIFANEVEVKTGLSRPQLRYMWSVYADDTGVTRCHFPIFTPDGDWHICGTTHEEGGIEVNHILARGFASRYLEMTALEIDNPLNLIALCKYHHVGEGFTGEIAREQPDGEPTPVYHIDNVWAKKNYRGTDKPTSYDKVMQQRTRLTYEGVPYYNDFWTPMMLYIAQEKYWEYYNKTHESFPIRPRTEKALGRR